MVHYNEIFSEGGCFLFKFFPLPYMQTLISAVSILLSSLLSAYCTWKITLKNTRINLEEQKKILRENIEHDKNYQVKRLCEHANILRLDICTALYQSLRLLKAYQAGEQVYSTLIPLNKSYPSMIAALSHNYQLEELSYIYQLYGILETVNESSLKSLDASKGSNNAAIKSHEILLRRLYGDNYPKIIAMDMESTSYRELYDNRYMCSKYKEILKKLDSLCVDSSSKESDK